MSKFKYADLTSRLIAKSALSHDPDSAEVASAISDLNSEIFKAEKRNNELCIAARAFCVAVSVYLSKENKVGDDIFDLYNHQALLIRMCDDVQECVEAEE